MDLQVIFVFRNSSWIFQVFYFPKKAFIYIFRRISSYGYEAVIINWVQA